jgi:hypothetical protein
VAGEVVEVTMGDIVEKIMNVIKMMTTIMIRT